MGRIWTSSEDRARLRHRQHLAELDAQNRRPRFSKLDERKRREQERLNGLLELARGKKES
jgi:hypothetical protein